MDIARTPVTSTMENVATTINRKNLLTFIAKLFIVDVCGDPGYVFELGSSGFLDLNFGTLEIQNIALKEQSKLLFCIKIFL